MEQDILNCLYDSIREMKPTAECKILIKKCDEEKEEFLKKIGENNREQLDNISTRLNEINDLTNKEDFCRGFIMAVKLIFGCIENKGDDQEE